MIRSNRSCVSDLYQYVVIARSRLVCTRIERSYHLPNTPKHLSRPKAPKNTSQNTLDIPLIPPGSSRQHKTSQDSTRQPQTAPTTATDPQSDFLECVRMSGDVFWCQLVSLTCLEHLGVSEGLSGCIWVIFRYT